jgi:hypothetical protein
MIELSPEQQAILTGDHVVVDADAGALIITNKC